MTKRRRLWLSSHDPAALARLLADEGALQEHVDATDTGALAGDAEVAARLDQDPGFVGEVIRDIARRGLAAPRASDVERRVVDDVILSVLAAPTPALARLLAHAVEDESGLLDLSTELRPSAREHGLEPLVVTIFEGRRACGARPGPQRYFLLGPDEAGALAAQARALIDALPPTPPAPRLTDSSSGFLDLLRIDARGPLDELLVGPLEEAAARGRGVFGRWA